MTASTGVFKDVVNFLVKLTRSPNFGPNILFSMSIYRNDPKFSDRYAWANSADPDQTAPRGAV